MWNDNFHVLREAAQFAIARAVHHSGHSTSIPDSRFPVFAF